MANATGGDGEPVPVDEEGHVKFIQDRISRVEHDFGDVCQATAAYARTTAKLRDRGDQLANSLRSYADKEFLNSTTKTALTGFASNLAGIQDYRNTQVQRLEAKVNQPLIAYGTNCKNARERLKVAFAMRDKVLKQEKNYSRIFARNPGDHIVAMQDMAKARVSAQRSAQDLEEEMDSFEKKKICDLKATFADFIKIEMMFHAKALEMYTQCYRSLNIIDEEKDLQQFREHLQNVNLPNRSTSPVRINLSPSAARAGVRTPTTNRSNPSTNLNTSVESHPPSFTLTQDDDDDDDDDEDDDKDEEDEEDEEDDTGNFSSRR